MSDEPEARMWDEERGSCYESRGRGAYYESAFASTEQLDRAPLLAEESYTEVAVGAGGAGAHCHWRAPGEAPSAVPQLTVALVLCGFFMVCELIGGYLAGSLSVMCDAAHMLSDCGGFALALLAFHCAKRKPDLHMSMGYKRAEVLGAMVSVLLIWVLTGIFVYVACVRLRSGDYSIESGAMLAVSGAGVAFNVLLAIVLHGCGKDIAHHHTHGGAACAGHAHAPAPAPAPRFSLFRRESKQSALVGGDYSMKDLSADAGVVTAPGRNINLRAALIHVIGDLIQSCGVLLASIIIRIYPEAKFIDPVCTFVFSILVLLTSAQVVRDALSILMQGVPKDFRYRACVTSLSGVCGVRHVHSLHVWAMSTQHTHVAAHVAIDELTDADTVLSECQRILRTEHSVQHATIQVERYSEEMERCGTCRDQPAARP